jgi:hypothetical protein
MKKLDINIVIQSTITTQTRQVTPSTTFSDNISIRGASEMQIVEDVNAMTDVAIFKLPLDKFFFNIEGLFYPVAGNDTNMYFIANEAKIAIYLSYDNTQSRQVFRGYIKNYSIEDDFVVFECENNMRFLKLQPKIKTSFDKIIKTGDIPDDLYVGDKFALKHLVYWLFRNEISSQRDDLLWDNYINNVVPYDHIYVMDELEMDKLIIENKLNPSVIIDKLNDVETYYFRSYVRNDNFVEQVIGNTNNQPYLRPETNLYIGYKFWNGNNAIDVKSDLINQTKSNNLTIGKDTEHSYLHKFAYPYEQGYNPIISHDIKYEDTGKTELVVIVITEDDNGNVPPAIYYPSDSAESIKLQARQKLNDENAKIKEEKDKAKDLTEKDYIRLIENETNTIRLKIPGLSEKSALELAFMLKKLKDLLMMKVILNKFI